MTLPTWDSQNGPSCPALPVGAATLAWAAPETNTPLFSIVIGVYDDWASLDRCLQSLVEETSGPSFEVIVVDDGGENRAPELILRWSQFYRLNVMRQTHAGVAAARNRGVQTAGGEILLFVDADCRFQPGCLAALAKSAKAAPHQDCFQLRLTGDPSSLVGKVEELRLSTLQKHLRQPNGCIRYLNTAGFAIRRTRVDLDGFVFDPGAVRAEDTLVLANLIQERALPLFVDEAVIQHAVSISLLEFFRKGTLSAFQEGRTYEIIASKGVQIRVSHRERLRMLASMWKTSRQSSIGRTAWMALTARQILRLLASYVYRCSSSLAEATHRGTRAGHAESVSCTGGLLHYHGKRL